MDFDVWVHVNCALWSSEVYETMDGTLMNVVAGYNRGQTLDCVGCAQKGATITCYRNRCTNSYHLECARNDGVTFLENKVLENDKSRDKKRYRDRDMYGDRYGRYTEKDMEIDRC